MAAEHNTLAEAEEVFNRAMVLPIADRIALANALLEDDQSVPLTEYEEACIAEADRRLAEYDRGEVTAISAEESKRRLGLL